MQLDDLLRGRPKFHRYEGQPYSWQLSDDALRFIDAHVHEGSTTLEIGAGVSTVLFALKGAKHLCIVHADEEIGRIKAFCREQHIPLAKLSFEVDRSERCLPRLDVTGLDLVLIDGAHGFPIPFLDWYYTADRLKVGGYLIIDDTQIWTGHTLKMFLKAEPEWEIEEDYAPRCVVFRKLEEGGCGKNESCQPYVVQQTLDLHFTTYPESLEWIRAWAPHALFVARERIALGPTRTLLRTFLYSSELPGGRLRALARRAASRVLPASIKRRMKRFLRL